MGRKCLLVNEKTRGWKSKRKVVEREIEKLEGRGTAIDKGVKATPAKE